MAEIVYLLCAFMSFICAFLLLRGARSNSSRLLLWAGLCFGFLAINNIILVVDLVILPDIDFQGRMLRNGVSAGAGSLMLFGLIWELT